MTPLEWMAWALVALTAVKLAVVLIKKPRFWVDHVARPVYSARLFWPVTLVAVFGGFYYLTRELTVVQIFASFFVVAFLFAAGLKPYAREMFAAFGGALDDRSFIRRSWFSLALWIVLIVWAAYYLIRY